MAGRSCDMYQLGHVIPVRSCDTGKLGGCNCPAIVTNRTTLAEVVVGSF